MVAITHGVTKGAVRNPPDRSRTALLEFERGDRITVEGRIWEVLRNFDGKILVRRVGKNEKEG